MSKLFQNKKKFLFIVVCDYIALLVSMLASMLIVQAKIQWTLDLLYWFIFNVFAVGFFFILFRLDAVSLRSVGIFDTLKIIAACLCLFLINLIYAIITNTVCTVRTSILFSFIFTIFVLLIRYSKRIITALRYVSQSGIFAHAFLAGFAFEYVVADNFQCIIAC